MTRRRGLPEIKEQRGEMTQGSGASFDPETIILLKKVLAEAERALPMRRRSSEARVKLATGILEAAANGERDPSRLRAAGLVSISDRRRPPQPRPSGPGLTSGRHEISKTTKSVSDIPTALEVFSRICVRSRAIYGPAIFKKINCAGAILVNTSTPRMVCRVPRRGLCQRGSSRHRRETQNGQQSQLDCSLHSKTPSKAGPLRSLRWRSNELEKGPFFARANTRV